MATRDLADETLRAQQPQPTACRAAAANAPMVAIA